MTVKAAHSRAGLYLLFEVQDGPSGSGGATDGVDFHIARDAAADLWTGRPVESRFSAAQYTLARSETQYQAAFGAPDKPETTLRRTYPCPFTMFVFRSYTVAEAKEKHGIVVRRHFLGNGRRAMEWFIPWAYVGKPGPMQEPGVGTRLGLVLGYNAAANLRWPAGVDPWAQAVEKGPDPNPWGDLEIGPRF
jgi:hypothetical protein